jgi:hypothetical protein
MKSDITNVDIAFPLSKSDPLGAQQHFLTAQNR